MDTTKDIVFAEVYEILKNIEKEKVMKIPSDIINMIKNGRNIRLDINIDWAEPLQNQGFCKDTINIIGYFNKHYWLEHEEPSRSGDSHLSDFFESRRRNGF